MLLNPLAPIYFLKLSSLKATTTLLFILLVKSNLLRLKGGLIGGIVALILLSGIILSSGVALASLLYAYNLKSKNNQKEEAEVDDKLEAISI
tara:strand:- start:897 stop:1172 length:276 start_codon:yes stop_codon:yes gene_type:complete